MLTFWEEQATVVAVVLPNRGANRSANELIIFTNLVLFHTIYHSDNDDNIPFLNLLLIEFNSISLLAVDDAGSTGILISAAVWNVCRKRTAVRVSCVERD